jgi:hypothetical protein
MTFNAGQVVEAELAGGTPDRLIRLRLDREPWPIGPKGNIVVSDGASVTAAVVGESIRAVEDDGTTTVRWAR